jgi:hypothetical protein
MNKKMLGFIFLVAILSFISLGCTNPDTKIALPLEDGNPNGDITVKNGDIGKMNDDLYVEIMVQIGIQGKNDPDWLLNGGYENYLKSKGITQEQFDAFVNKSVGDPIHHDELTKKIYDRVDALSNE